MEKISVRKTRFVLITAILFAGVPAIGGGHASDHGHSRQTAHAPANKERAGYFSSLWNAFLAKLDHMQKLDENNDRLRRLVAKLEIDNARLALRAGEWLEVRRGRKAKEEAKNEGGLEVSRTVASLQAHDATLLSKPPKAIFAESMRSFNSGDFETAAKAFGYLSEHPDNGSYDDATTHYLAGVSFFKLNNFKTAARHFTKALERATGDNVAYAPRSLGWLALCHAKLGDKTAEKSAVRELIEKFPKSKEARRLNRHAS